MRIVSGSARGRRLHEPKGRDIRPTTDKVKESIFNIIQFDVEGRTVLDLFAGTGQLGIEALSRGAAGAVFTDASPAAVALVRENLSEVGLGECAEVYQTDAISYLEHCGRKFHLILLDPPYGTGLLEKALKTIFEFDILRQNGIIICESGVEEELGDIPAPYELRKTYRYGKIKLSLILRGGE